MVQYENFLSFHLKLTGPIKTLFQFHILLISYHILSVTSARETTSILKEKDKNFDKSNRSKTSRLFYKQKGQ